MATLQSINPATGEVIGSITTSTPQEIKEKVQNANDAKVEWKEIGVDKRKEYVEKIYQKFVEHKEELANFCTKEMGMPKKFRGMLDIDEGLHYFRWYIDNVASSIAPEVTFEDSNIVNTVYHEPLGVAAVISPWNYPVTGFIWGAIPSLLVGNPVVWKHSEECILISQRINQLIEECGLPKGVFSVVYGGGDVGDILVHEDIQMITFTGSTKVGQYLYKVAAEKFIKILLELGGSAPGIVFEDADIQEVVEMVFFNRFLNSGQICDGLKRLIVHESKFDEVVEKIKQDLLQRKIGDPEEETTDIGPLVAERQVEVLEQQVADAISKGAQVIVGGCRAKDKAGAYYLPTLLTKVTQDMKVWKEEVFGPVLPIVPFTTEEEAIHLANDTQYGLGSYIFSKNKERVQRIALKIDAGMVSSNSAFHIRPSNPFGGYKKSGMGREHGKYGLRELCQLKIVAAEK